MPFSHDWGEGHTCPYTLTHASTSNPVLPRIMGSVRQSDYSLDLWSGPASSSERRVRPVGATAWPQHTHTGPQTALVILKFSPVVVLGGKENRREHGGKVEIYMRTGARCFRGTRRFCRGYEKWGIEWSLERRGTLKSCVKHIFMWFLIIKEVLLHLCHNSLIPLFFMLTSESFAVIHLIFCEH